MKVLEKVRCLHWSLRLLISVVLLGIWIGLASLYNGTIEEPIARAENVRDLWILTAIVAPVLLLSLFCQNRPRF